MLAKNLPHRSRENEFTDGRVLRVQTGKGHDVLYAENGLERVFGRVQNECQNGTGGGRRLRSFCACRATSPHPLAPLRRDALRLETSRDFVPRRAGEPGWAFLQVFGNPPPLPKSARTGLNGFTGSRVYGWPAKDLGVSPPPGRPAHPLHPHAPRCLRLENVPRLFRAGGFARPTDESTLSPPVGRAKTGLTGCR